jgi:hypothetical protein
MQARRTSWSERSQDCAFPVPHCTLRPSHPEASTVSPRKDHHEGHEEHEDKKSRSHGSSSFVNFVLFVVLLFALAITACAGGRGSGGFDISSQRALEAASELAVSNLQALIDFGQEGGNGGGAQAASEGIPPNDLQCTPDGFCLECVEANGIFTATSFFVGAPRGAECPPECRRDEIFLTSADPRTCEGEVRNDIPVGCGFKKYAREWKPGSANLIGFAALFEPSGAGTGCAEPQSFGLITPAFNVCTEASKGTMTLDGFRSDVDVAEHRFARFTDFSVDLVADGDPCVVHATLNGHLERRSGNGAGFSATYDDFIVTVREEGAGVVLVTQDGTLHTDCAGVLEYETIEPLRLTAGESCPRAGLLHIMLPNGRQSLTHYTASGGVEVDFGADGVVDETFTSCTDSALSLCQVEEPADLCAACESDDDCGDGFVCLPCTFDCTSDIRRCVAVDDFAVCDGEIY